MKQIHSYPTNKKRQPEILKPHVTYNESIGLATDKQMEFLIIQHKLMNEFLSKRNLIQAYNEFQNREFTKNQDCKNWMKKWAVDHSDLSRYITRL